MPPQWTHRPPDQHAGHALPIRRTPVQGQLVAIITSEQLIGCNTHFYHGRTLPCEAPDCPACATGVPWRWHGYVTCVDYRTAEHFILELTAIPCETLARYESAHGSLRGTLIHAKRLSPRPNGRITISLRPADLATIRLPRPPDLPALLTTLWGLTQIPDNPTRHMPEGRAIQFPRPTHTTGGNNQ